MKEERGEGSSYIDVDIIKRVMGGLVVSRPFLIQ